MRNLSVSIRAFCVLPFLTGGLDVLGGARFLRSAGIPLSEELSVNATLDSQVRFWGAIWIGYGIALWRASSTLESDRVGFRILCGVLTLSGIGRLASMARCGSPGAPLAFATALELAGGIGGFVWHSRLLNRNDLNQ